MFWRFTHETLVLKDWDKKDHIHLGSIVDMRAQMRVLTVMQHFEHPTVSITFFWVACFV